MFYDLVVANGRIVTPGGSFLGSLGIREGRIAAFSEEVLLGQEVLDARGLAVLPGGVDLHVHFSEPGRTHWEGWGPGSRAAAAGGITTVVEMPLNAIPATTTRAALEAKVAAARGQSVVDYALWGGLVTDNLDHLAELAEAGVIGFKAFMFDTKDETFPPVGDGLLFEGMRRIGTLGHFLAVHAESTGIIARLTEGLKGQGRRDRRAWGEARPPISELEAIQRALLLAREADCPLHFVHVSIPEGVALIQEARAKGQQVTLETCAHYLTLTEEDLVRLGPVAKCAPPLRDALRLEGLWEALLRGKLDCVTSDHSPCPTEDKARGEEDIWSAWAGITGIQTLLPLMLSEGVHRRGLALERLCELLATTPAKIAGLWPRKGEIRLGADADLLLVDLERPWQVERDWLYSRHPHSPFIGWPMKGWIIRVILRGRTVAKDGHILGEPRGIWLRRGALPTHAS
ncbi:MAG: allantoinase AllB [Meiothermus silvanus]|nr:allantoinase AllB [Allomeiothermus silvanus]